MSLELIGNATLAIGFDFHSGFSEAELAWPFFCHY